MSPSDQTLRRLLEVGRSLVSELDPDAVLERIVEEARVATAARYAALGVLNEQRTELARFITAGLDERGRAAVGALPRGRGLLGLLIARPVAVRVDDVQSHPESYGFPAGHPVMHSFLGVPITIRGKIWGNLYLTDKRGGGQFSQDDEEVAVILADLAATAIENARLYHRSEERREQLERAVMGLEAARDIADATGTAFELEGVLGLVATRARPLVSARSVLISLRDGDQLTVRASAGDAAPGSSSSLALAEAAAGRVVLTGLAERIPELHAGHSHEASRVLGYEPRSALLLPIAYHGEVVGVLAAFDRGAGAQPFTTADEEMLRTFAAAAATAVAINRSVEADRLRAAIASSEAERRRWARELHDETLQALGGLRVLLASALRRAEPALTDQAMRQAITDIEAAIENLRTIISDLRPSLLDDLGLQPAIEALTERRRAGGLEIVSELELPDRASGADALPPELETTVYRLVQEALTNVVKHSSASTVQLSVRLSERRVLVEVADNGVGFDPASNTVGFGLAGIRERIHLAGGTFQLQSGPAGTVLSASIPVHPPPPEAGLGTDQATSQRVVDQLGTGR
jgi:signal transduction histidine kinase